jgi:hypothetical protein
MITLRQLDQYLGAQVYDTQVMRNIPSLRDTADRLDRLRHYRQLLWDWAQEQAARERAQWEARLDALQTAHGALLDRTHTDYQTFGVTVTGRELKALQAAWPQVSDLVDRHVRDERNLGPLDPTASHRQQLQSEGMVATGPEPADPVVEMARRIRIALATAAAQAAQLEAIDRQIDAIDPWKTDEHLAAIEAELLATGLVSVPVTPDARPELDPDLVAVVVAAQAVTTSTASRG